jgi:hypothetical protein
MFTMEAGASWLLLGHPRGAIPILEKEPSEWLDNSQMRDYVVRQAADCVGMLGTCALIGGAPAGAEFSLDHLTTLWGKRIVGVLAEAAVATS